MTWKSTFRVTCRVRACAVAILCIVVVASVTAHATGGREHEAPKVSAPSVRPVLDQYCVRCHNEASKSRFANLALDTLDADDIGAEAERWETVVQKLRAGTMPPGSVTRPDAETYTELIATLEDALDTVAAAAPDPGRPTVQRLNRTEYVNAVRDLLAVDIEGPRFLPADNSGFGFDNIGDVLSVSPSLLARYLSTARKVARIAVGDTKIRPVSQIYTVPTLLVQDDRRSDDLPFGTRGGLSVRHNFPLNGEYVVRVDFVKDYGDSWRGRHVDSLVDVRLDGERLTRMTVEKERAQKGIMVQEGEETNPGPIEYRFVAQAGAHDVSVGVVKRTLVTEGVGPRRLPVGSTSYGQLNSTNLTSGTIELGVQSLEIIGPFNGTAPRDTASRQQIFVCEPSGGGDDESCARTIVTRLARRAYRRPATDGELEVLLDFYRQGRDGGGFDDGIQFALERLLIAPAFLFRAEASAVDGAEGVEAVSDFDLASRLSFFLWSTIPDDELLDVAERGELRDAQVLDRQIARMMADPRVSQLVDNFFGQWLMLRNVQSHLPDYLIYPTFDDNLREAFERETQLFLKAQLDEDRSALELLTADYTFVNERLARHYGLPNVYGSHFRRVSLTSGRRAGLLGQGGVLMVTAYPDRTSPVVRGKWLLENILGTPPPEPPPNVPPFPENDGASAPKSVRARMELHRQNPVCASCHSQLDPLGFGLENFDGIGRWRDTDAGTPVDVSGQFPNGLRFTDVAEFRAALLQGYASEFISTLTKKLMTYALGRGVEYYDMSTIRTIVRDAEAHDYRWSSLIRGIVHSTPFQMRRAES